jgi:protein-L-isoaspartate(D-aspartate) O-methyltransferase
MVGAGDGTAHPGDPAASERERMVRDQLAARGIRDSATLAAMGLVPRERFVPQSLRDRAYRDGALSIGHGQTISQPYIVARMTEALHLADLGWPWTGPAPSVLDVGTGSGYQAAILAQIGARVTSIERDPELAAAARDRLGRLGYQVHVVIGDGSAGYPPGAPYAGIVVGAAAPSIPRPLADQLADGGRLVVPVGSRSLQHLTLVRRKGRELLEEVMDACVFVPLVGRYAHST